MPDEPRFQEGQDYADQNGCRNDTERGGVRRQDVKTVASCVEDQQQPAGKREKRRHVAHHEPLHRLLRLVLPVGEPTHSAGRAVRSQADGVRSPFLAALAAAGAAAIVGHLLTLGSGGKATRSARGSLAGLIGAQYRPCKEARR